MITNLARYNRIAPVYDLLDLPFERRRYRALRPLLFSGMSGRLLDAGVGTGRNCEFYPPEAIVSGIDASAAMLTRAHIRWPTRAAGGRLHEMDIAALKFPNGSFDAAVSSFLFCVLGDEQQRFVNYGAWSSRVELSASWSMYGREELCAESSHTSGSHGSTGLMAQASIATRSGMFPPQVSNCSKADMSSTIFSNFSRYVSPVEKRIRSGWLSLVGRYDLIPGNYNWLVSEPRREGGLQTALASCASTFWLSPLRTEKQLHDCWR